MGVVNSNWTRREFLASLATATAAAGALTTVAGVANAGSASIAFPDSPEIDSDRWFPQGIASGDPRPDGVLLWTRVDAAEATPVHFQVGNSPSFENIVRAGSVTASPDSDYTIRVRLAGLEPGRRYWYRFRAADVSSPVGRTLTTPLPTDDVPATVAVASCQDYQGRWYHAWRALADRADEIDFVLFLGDYIYEYERFPHLQEPAPGRAIQLPDGLVIDERQGVIAAHTLEDYRTIYRMTRADRDLRRMHQLCPFVIIWDDHEHANDAWQDHSVDFNERRGDEQDTARREAATRAWYEHLPVNVEYEPQRGFPGDIVTWRALRWGRHAELFLTDQRYYRDDHLIPESKVDLPVGKLLPFSPLGSRTFCVKSVFDEREAAAQPTMLGERQRDWLIDAVAGSDATWKAWASALMVAQFVLDLREFDTIPPAFRNAFYFKTDQWDGFSSERKRILSELSDVANLVVLSGDLHGFYAAELRPDFNDPESPPSATEFTVAGISSISLLEQVEAVVKSQPALAATGLGKLTPIFDDNLLASSPHFVYADSRGYGAGIARFTADQLELEFLTVTDVRDPESNGAPGCLRFRVPANSARIERVDA